MNIERRIEKLGIRLPDSSPPKAMYIPVKQVGNLLFVAGQIPMADGVMLYPGHVGEEVTLEQAQEASRQCIINMLSALRAYLGDLDKVKNVVKVQAFVSSKTGFNQQHIVVNAASSCFMMFLEKLAVMRGLPSGSTSSRWMPRWKSRLL